MELLCHVTRGLKPDLFDKLSGIEGDEGLEFLDVRPEHEHRLRRVIENRLRTRPQLDET